jgi:hypothetical protein
MRTPNFPTNDPARFSRAGNGSARTVARHLVRTKQLFIRCESEQDVREPRPTKFNPLSLDFFRQSVDE